MVALAILGLAYAYRVRPSQVTVIRERGLSVLLITVDTLRADALGAYGRADAGTPWIDRLAADGVRFAQAHAQNVITLPSHANILSGRYPFEHGIRDNAGFRFPPHMPTLATVLKENAYRTGAFVSAFPLDSRFGLARGFDVYDDGFGGGGENTAFRMQERPGSVTVEAARRWLAAEAGHPTFTWVHVYEPHFPYDPPEPFASRFRAQPYHGEVAAADDALRPLLEPLLQAGRAGRTLVVLTADHGEALGEHGEMTHGIFAYEGTLRVPLILFAPRLLKRRVVPGPARHVDILPTILDALALPVPAGLPGRSLLAASAGGAAPDEPSYFESLSAATNRGWAPLYGVLRQGTKYIDLPLPELYDLDADPKEERNLIAARSGRLEELRSELRGFRAQDRGIARGEESAEAMERLRSLGYVTSSSARAKERYTEEDDPKRLVDLDRAVQDAISLYFSGDLQGALAAGEELARRRPNMPLAYVHLAFLRREAGDLQGAVVAGEHALTLNPSSTEVAALVGVYLNETGRSREALRLLEPYAQRPDPDLDVLIARGVALASLGREADALASFEDVLRIDPSSALAHVNIGTVHLMRHRYPEAEGEMRAALRLDATSARAYNALGVIAAETGHPEQAVEHWRKALTLEPRELDIVYNIGSVLQKQGRVAEARPYLERFAREAPLARYARDLAKVRAWLQAPAPPPR